MTKPHSFLRIASIAAALAALATTVQAQDFYKGKSIDLFVGSSPGGGYDGYARLVARHYGRVVPGNPGVVVRNMPGASSMKMLNHLYNVAPKDGTAIGAPQNGIAFEPLLKVQGGALFDPMKINWLGTITKEVALLTVWHTHPFKEFKDLQTKEMIAGAAGAMTDDAVFARLLNATAGTKIKLVLGYQGSSAMMLAVEKGEIQGMPGWNYSSLSSRRPQWLKDGSIRIIAQTALKKHPDLPNVPLSLDYAKSGADRNVMELIAGRLDLGRPYCAPPGIPQDRYKILLSSFEGMLKDKTFLADAKKTHFEVNPTSAAEIGAILKKAYASPADVVQKAHDILAAGVKKKK